MNSDGKVLKSYGGDTGNHKYKNDILRNPSMIDDRDFRDRLARAEQNIINNADNFRSFKQDDFQSLKAEVHTMRGELNTKVDQLLKQVSSINVTMAKWMGAGGILIFIGQFGLNKLF